MTILERIKSGEVSIVFRRWQRPTVKSGGTLNTAIGQLSIKSVSKISLHQVTAADARAAGFLTKRDLLDELSKRNGGVYKIVLTYAGEDPRIVLREDDQLSEDELGDILLRLNRLDARSRNGKWTASAMAAINSHPGIPASKLASEIGCNKDWLKTNVQKLKNLGLTISHKVGYSLSPRGIRVFEQLQLDESEL